MVKSILIMMYCCKRACGSDSFIKTHLPVMAWKMLDSKILKYTKHSKGSDFVELEWPHIFCRHVNYYNYETKPKSPVDWIKTFMMQK